MGDIIIRDNQTGECQRFTASATDFAKAENYRREIEEKGHTISDDGTDALSRLSYVYGSYRR